MHLCAYHIEVSFARLRVSFGFDPRSVSLASCLLCFRCMYFQSSFYFPDSLTPTLLALPFPQRPPTREHSELLDGRRIISMCCMCMCCTGCMGCMCCMIYCMCCMLCCMRYTLKSGVIGRPVMQKTVQHGRDTS